MCVCVCARGWHTERKAARYTMTRRRRVQSGAVGVCYVYDTSQRIAHSTTYVWGQRLHVLSISLYRCSIVVVVHAHTRYHSSRPLLWMAECMYNIHLSMRREVWGWSVCTNPQKCNSILFCWAHCVRLSWRNISFKCHTWILRGGRFPRECLIRTLVWD